MTEEEIAALISVECDRVLEGAGVNCLKCNGIVFGVSQVSKLGPALLQQASAANRETNRLFQGRGQGEVRVIWADQDLWERLVTPVPELVYGAPFALVTGHIVIPAADIERPKILDAVLGALREEAHPTEDIGPLGFFDSIFVHELFHVYWARAGYPVTPRWLSEGMAQLAVLEARQWPDVSSHCRTWVDIHSRLLRSLYPEGGLTALSTLFETNIPPLQYQWIMAALFELFELLNLESKGNLISTVLELLPREKCEGDFSISDEQAARVIDQAVGRPFNREWWTQRRVFV